MSLVVDEHRYYLSDDVRLEAFRAAIHQVVRPGDIVADLASGTGILGLIACQAGAARVYSVEVSGMIEVARAVAVANGVADRIVFIQGLSSEVTLPERVDAIVCDQIGNFGFEAGLVEFGCDARDRWLRPGGRIVPARVDLFLAPVEDPPLHAQVEFWNSKPAGFDFAEVRAWAANTGYPAMSAAGSLLGAAGRIAGFDSTTMTPAATASRVELPIERAGTVHGLAGWFSATLADGVALSNAPTARARVGRRNVFFPIDRPVAAQPGDIVRVAMHIIPSETIVTWTVEVLREGGVLARARHCTLHGMLLSGDDLRRTHPRFVPTLTARGRARLTVLQLCDGRQPLAAIEREVLARHPDLFGSLPAAAAFVVEVVAAYANP